MNRALLALTLTACQGTEIDPTEFVLPLDGQTAVPLESPLVARAPALDVPPDYPADALIRVVDLEDGGFVPGLLERDGALWLFTPTDGWRDDTRYAWTLDLPPDVTHGPEYETSIAGDAVFDTSSRLDALAAATGPAGEVCFVFSRPLEDGDLADPVLVIDDTAFVGALTPLAGEQWRPELPDVIGDLAIDVACTDGPATGIYARLWLDGTGPWLVEVQAAEPADVVASLLRRTP
jgi:hypothetical protein